MSTPEDLDRLIDQHLAEGERASLSEETIMPLLAASTRLVQLQEIVPPPAFAHRLEGALRARLRTLQLHATSAAELVNGQLEEKSKGERMSNLAQIRQSLGLSQEELAGLTRTVPTRVIRRAEEGNPIAYPLVKQILETLNVLLLEAGRSAVTFRDLGISVR